MLKLYDMDLSGNCYKVRLFLSLLGEDYERIPVNLAAGENMSTGFKKLNPRGEIPVLVDGDNVVWDSHAILVYLALKYNASTWLPADARSVARIHQWMAVAAHEVQYGLAAARASIKFGRPGNLAEFQEKAEHALKLIDEQLAQSRWLAGDGVTIADLACYPYVRCAEDGGVPIDAHGNIRRWFDQIQVLDGYVSMIETAETEL